MVTIKKVQLPKNHPKGRILHGILHEGLMCRFSTLHLACVADQLNHGIIWAIPGFSSSAMQATLHFATLSLCIQVEFLNDERRKEKNR